MVTAINRVTGIYRRDLGIQFQLIANMDKLIYTDPDTDPYTDADGSAMLDQNQANSDDQFSAISIAEINTYATAGNGNSCPIITNTGNSVPTVNAGQSLAILRQTPFTLTGAGSDPDGNGLTYSWENWTWATPAPPSAYSCRRGPPARDRAVARRPSPAPSAASLTGPATTSSPSRTRSSRCKRAAPTRTRPTTRRGSTWASTAWSR